MRKIFHLTISCVALAAAGCAQPTVYQSPSTVPAGFDVEVLPSGPNDYSVSGQTLTLKDLYSKIHDSQGTDKPIKTLLLQNDNTTVMQLVCAVAIVDKLHIAGYQEVKGVIRPMQVKGSSQAYGGFVKQCLQSAGAD